MSDQTRGVKNGLFNKLSNIGHISWQKTTFLSRNEYHKAFNNVLHLPRLNLASPYGKTQSVAR